MKNWKHGEHDVYLATIYKISVQANSKTWIEQK